MQFLKFVLITALVVVALTAGLVVTAAIVVVALIVLIARRLLRGMISSPAPARLHRETAASPASDVIEITATEVPMDRSQR